MIEDSTNFQLVNAAFPHIGKKIKLFWGYPEFVTLMLNLQTDSRGGKRKGFPGDVLFALMDLEEKHDIEFPHLKRQIISSWHTLWPVFALVFDQPKAVASWQAVDDRVMGGVSSSRMCFDPEGHAVFQGTVSLAQGGGFASVRTLSTALQGADIQGYALDLCGDAKRYKFSLRTDNRFDGITYQAEFEAAAGQWQSITLPVSAFVPRLRGRAVPDAPAFAPDAVCQVGLMIADKQAGPFALAVRSIRSF